MKETAQERDKLRFSNENFNEVNEKLNSELQQIVKEQVGSLDRHETRIEIHHSLDNLLRDSLIRHRDGRHNDFLTLHDLQNLLTALAFP